MFHSVHAEAMISWKEFHAVMPWTVALLVGGGFALAEGAKVGWRSDANKIFYCVNLFLLNS